MRFTCPASLRWLILIVVIASPPSTAAEVSPGQMQSGSLLLRMQSGYVVATRMNTDLSVHVSGLVARVSVRQEFRNDGPEWVEGVYVFPLPDEAAVDRLRMHIGERFIEGEIREKEKARRQYEQARSEGRKASLVEQQRANLFTTSVANIGPGETVTVEIEYLEDLRYDDGSFSLRLPLTITPRYVPGVQSSDRRGSGWSADTDRVPDASLITPPVVTRSNDHRVSLRAVIDAGVPLESVVSRYHAIDVRPVRDRYEIALAGGDVPMDHDVELTWRPVPDTAARAMVFSETQDGEPHVLFMMIPPDDDAVAAPVMAREIVYVIDTSGSMHGTSIEQARKALLLALDRLRPIDRFNVIQFNSVTSAAFRDSLEARPWNVGQAKHYVRALTANGGTEMRPALELALRNDGRESYLRQVIFITDGSVGNEQELYALIENRLGDTRLFTVGIGSAPNGWFMRKAAETGRGSYTFISALHEVDEKMGGLFRRLERPQVTDIRIEWPQGVEAYPDTVPDLYDGEPILVRAKLRGELRDGDQVLVSGNSAAGSWGADLALAAEESSPGVAAIWARARIEDLLDRQRRGANPDETRSAVIETALKYHLVSRHTSLVAVDKTPVRPESAGLRQEQVPGLLPHGQSHQAIFGFAATATPSRLHLIAGFSCVLVAFLLFLTGWRREVSAGAR